MFHVPNGNRQSAAKARTHSNTPNNNSGAQTKPTIAINYPKRKDTKCTKTCFVSQFRYFLVYFSRFALHIATLYTSSFLFVCHCSPFLFLSLYNNETFLSYLCANFIEWNKCACKAYGSDVRLYRLHSCFLTFWPGKIKDSCVKCIARIRYESSVASPKIKSLDEKKPIHTKLN